jgi:hypothetical protein
VPTPVPTSHLAPKDDAVKTLPPSAAAEAPQEGIVEKKKEKKRKSVASEEDDVSVFRDYRLNFARN